MVGQLNLEKQIGRDTLADYKLFAENGRTLEHSIGVKAIKGILSILVRCLNGV